jgi:hypothetical protein
MRRSRTIFRHSRRSGDIRKDLTAEQLAGIGGVTLAYNEAEVLIDILMSLSLGLLTHSAHEVTSRINGIDGKIELAKIGMRELGADQKTTDLLGGSLGDGGFKSYKKYRDAVIHARVLDAPAGIALSPSNRGKIDEVLLTVEALNGLYDRLVLVRQELIEACNISIRLFTERRMGPIRKSATEAAADPLQRALAIVDLPKRQYEQEIQDCLSRFQEHQKNRLSLPRLPEFPVEPPIPQATEAPPPQSEPSAE